VTEEDVADIVSSWTGIPVSRLQEGEREKLVKLENHLHLRVVGQDEAIKAVATLSAALGQVYKTESTAGFIHFSRTYWRWQTELARALAEFFVRRRKRHDPHRHERIHGETHVARLIGAPPGYVGYEEGGQLSEAVRRKPYSSCCSMRSKKRIGRVHVLLQVLDDRPHHGRAGENGRFQEHGRHHDFPTSARNTLRRKNLPKRAATGDGCVALAFST